MKIVEFNMSYVNYLVKNEIELIIANGYYENDVDNIIQHTSITYELFIKGLNTKEVIKDSETLEGVFYDTNENNILANWYNIETDIHEYIVII